MMKDSLVKTLGLHQPAKDSVEEKKSHKAREQVINTRSDNERITDGHSSPVSDLTVPCTGCLFVNTSDNHYHYCVFECKHVQFQE